MRKVLLSAMIGNALEWYDYALYANFAYILGKHFFPNEETREIMTLAVFAAGFIVRPFGAYVFGYIGDKLGRKIALAISILTMAFPTAMIGLLPSYEVIGIAAPIILTIIRLVQGFSLGGEFSGCIAYIVENSHDKYRGVAGSAAFISMCGGMLLGALTALGFKYYFDEETLVNWAWRIPFILGLFIGLIGLYIRWKLKESPVYEQAKSSGNLSRSPLRDLLKNNLKELFVAMGVYLTVTVPFYVTTVYLTTYLRIYTGLSSEYATKCNAIILCVMIVFLLISGYISDKIGRKPILIFGCLLFSVFSYPAFWILNNFQDSFPMIILAVSIMSAMCGIYMGPVPTLLVEIFPTKIRFTGVAISYNISAAIFGGTAPMISEMMIKFFNDNNIISYYIAVFACFTLASLMMYKETYKKSLYNEIY